MPQPEIFSIICSRERLGKTGSNTPIGICRALPAGGSLSFSEGMSLTRAELTFGAATAAATRLVVVRNFRRPGDLGACIATHSVLEYLVWRASIIRFNSLRDGSYIHRERFQRQLRRIDFLCLLAIRREQGGRLLGRESLWLQIEADLLLSCRHIQNHENGVILVTPQIREHVRVVLIQRNVLTIGQNAVLMPQCEQSLVELQNRVGIFQLRSDIVSLIARRNGQPGRSLAEAGIGALIPLHGSALAVSALLFRPTQLPNGILHVLPAFGIVVCHLDLFAVIHDRCATER